MTPAQQHYRWRADVERVVNALQREFPDLECVTYIDHPWPGWDGRSFDVWDDAQTITPASKKQLRRARRFLMTLDWGPWIRHTILLHALWTSFGGYSYWAPSDHSGNWRHLHVT